MGRRDWLRKYPGHCRDCEGHTDSANPCQACLGTMLCPRCGKLTNDEGEDAIDPEDASIPCRACGWLEMSGHGCPPSRAMLSEAKRRHAETAERQRSAEIRRLRARLAELES